MRIFLLPLTTRQALIYCQRGPVKVGTKPRLIDRVTTKAAETWASWEAAESGWKKQVVTYGNRGLQRIPYQEWSLKSFPPSNPKLQAEQITDGKKFEVIYPGNVMHEEDVPKVMARLARERKQLHWNRFIGSMVAMPFTIPFGLIPILPNIPFFYTVYRCWSHWHALKGSDHLDFILDNRLFRLKSTDAVEKLFEDIAPDSPDFHFVTRSQITDGTAPPEKMILTKNTHNKIAKVMQVPELSNEIERAVWQVTRQMREQQAKTPQPKDSEAKEKPVLIGTTQKKSPKP